VIRSKPRYSIGVFCFSLYVGDTPLRNHPISKPLKRPNKPSQIFPFIIAYFGCYFRYSFIHLGLDVPDTSS